VLAFRERLLRVLDVRLDLGECGCPRADARRGPVSISLFGVVGDERLWLQFRPIMIQGGRWVSQYTFADSIRALEPLMSTLLTASTLGRGGSTSYG